MSTRDTKHNQIQREGKERDLYICQACGSLDQVEGHHIINYQFRGEASIDNIITLCQKCHKQVHRGNIDIMKF